jgi:Xaa-Pro dipeptidase
MIAESERFDAEALRVQKLQAKMALLGFDIIIISNPNTFRYFTGHFPLLTISPTRPWYLLIPASGQPIACVPAIGENDMRSESHLSEFRVWASPNPADEGRSCLLDTLREIVPQKGKIGLEAGREMRPLMPTADLDRIRSALPRIQFADASDLIWSLRMIKDAFEVGLMLQAIAAAEFGFTRIVGELRPGLTEHEAVRLLRQMIFEGGADAVPYLACSSGPGGYLSLTRAPSDRHLQRGDVIGFDIGATVKGYWCDFNRNFNIIDGNANMQRTDEALQRSIVAAFQRCKPGVAVADLRAEMDSSLALSGFVTDGKGRFGHGVGLDFTEPPSLTGTDDAVLEAGMVITLEPSVQVQNSKLILVAEEMVLITNTGAEMLTAKTTLTSYR